MFDSSDTLYLTFLSFNGCSIKLYISFPTIVKPLLKNQDKSNSAQDDLPEEMQLKEKEQRLYAAY